MVIICAESPYVRDQQCRIIYARESAVRERGAEARARRIVPLRSYRRRAVRGGVRSRVGSISIPKT